jgi:prolyl-tRNA synthetase
VDALLDDRLERPGVKFKDADLIGIPYRVVIGEAKVKQGKVELFERSTRKLELVDLDSLVKAVTAKLSA